MNMVENNMQTRKIYSEVYSILDMLGEDYIKKLPEIIYENIKKLKLEDYNPKYTEEESLKKQHVSRDAISMIAFFDLSYWCENEEQKTNLKKLFKENGEKENNIFANNTKKVEAVSDSNKNENLQTIEKTEEVCNLPSKVEKNSIFKKIFNFIKNIIKK